MIQNSESKLNTLIEILKSNQHIVEEEKKQKESP